MIYIMVDSASDCRDNDVYDLFVPLTVSIGGEEYRDGVEKSSRF